MATSMRSHANSFISIIKPIPSTPNKFSLGTRTSSKKSSQVSWPFIPILFNGLPLLKPTRSASTRINERLAEPFSEDPVLHTTMAMSHK